MLALFRLNVHEMPIACHNDWEKVNQMLYSPPSFVPLPRVARDPCDVVDASSGASLCFTAKDQWGIQ